MRCLLHCVFAHITIIADMNNSFVFYFVVVLQSVLEVMLVVEFIV